MPNPDGTLLWNEDGFVSNLQNYQNLGGDMNRAAEYLYAGAGANDPTQVSATTKDRIRNMSAPETEWQKRQNMIRDQGFASGFMNSGAYNPNGANTYLIQNSIGLNSGNPAGQYINKQGNGYTSTNPNAAVTPPPAVTSAPPSTLVTNSAENNQGLTRENHFKRSNAGGYSNGAQYAQAPTLPNSTTGQGAGGYGGLGFSSARGGGAWGNGSNWNKAIWR